MLEQEEAIPRLFPQSWEHKLFKMPGYAEALKVLFSGTRGSSPTSQKQPPHPQNFHLPQSSQKITILIFDFYMIFTITL